MARQRHRLGAFTTISGPARRAWTGARTRTLARAALAALLSLAAPAPGWAAAPAGAPEVDVLLVLAADVSRSIDARKFDLQRKGYAAALVDPRVLEAIASNPDKRIAVAFVEWAGAASQKLVIDWTLIAGEADARGFAAAVLAAPRSFEDRTAIGSAIDFAARQFDHAPFAAPRRIVDVSGDGASNSGSDVTGARDAALAQGVTSINGLVILSGDEGPRYLYEHTHPPGGLADYYRSHVAGGAGSFVDTAQDFESFDRSLIGKIVEELS